jgi:hypothetical protein
MASQLQMASQFPPVTILPAASDAAGRTGAWINLRNALKAWIIVEVNQGAANTVALSVLQATSLAGGGAKAIGGVEATPLNVWLNDATSSSDALAALGYLSSYTTDATLADKLVVMEIVPESALDLVNGFHYVTVQTGASNASNVTAARIHVFGSYQSAVPPTTMV